MPDETSEDQPEQEQGEDSDRNPALIIRVDEEDAYINLATLVSSAVSSTSRRLHAYMDHRCSSVTGCDVYERGSQETNRGRARHSRVDYHLALGTI